MVQNVQEANKPLVLEAFDILFNRPNYAAAEMLLVAQLLPAQHAHRARATVSSI